MKKTIVLLVVGLSSLLYPARGQRSSSNADIVGIGIAAVGTAYHGRCPVMVHFKATIYVTHIPMKVRYYWERDGVRSKTKSLVIPAESVPKLNVKTDWPIGVPGKAFRATVRLHVLADAGEVISDVKESTGHCTR